VSPEGKTNALFQVMIVDRLGQVAENAVVQGTSPDSVVRVGGHPDRRNDVPLLDEVSVELGSAHSRYVDIGDQAGGLREQGRFQEVAEGKASAA
jgi:hypothetical protein